MTVFVALLLIAVFVGGVLLAAEGFTRAHVVAHVQQRFHDVAGIPAVVTFGATPLIWQSIARSVGVVEIVTVDSADDLRVQIRVDGITGDDAASTLRVVTCHGHVPYPRLVELISERDLFGESPHKLMRIRGNASRRTIRVDLVARTGLLTMPVTVTLRPELDVDGLSFRVLKVHTILFGLPTNFAQGIVDDVADTLRQSVAKFVTIERVSVGDTGFDFYLRGEQVVVDLNLTRPQFGNRGVAS